MVSQGSILESNIPISFNINKYQRLGTPDINNRNLKYFLLHFHRRVSEDGFAIFDI